MALLDVAASAPESLAASGLAPLGSTCRGKGTDEFMRVVVRARPMNEKELEAGEESILSMDAQRGTAVLRKPGGTERDCKEFTFDAALDETMTQQQVFDETALEILDGVMDGFNGTIFAYGITGAGKTFTMTGPDDGAPEAQGLLPRAFGHIFANIDTTSQDIKYLVRGSYIEIYNEEIRDLLSSTPKERCELKEDPNSGVYVKDLSTFVVQGTEEMQDVLVKGLRNRSVNWTQMNENSSRSHSMFMLTIEQCSTGADEAEHIRVGKLNMVDLAGSERPSKTGATGDRLKEGMSINLSLSALGNVISALVDGKSSHIPYRDSKLTRLLQDSLGGNTKTVMVANCSPAGSNYEDSLSTLRYAYRARSIKNKPRINADPKEAMIRGFQDEIMRLKAELETAASASGAAGGASPALGAYAGLPADLLDAALPPLPPASSSPAPRVEKQVEYVEKVVEKTVEREVVVEQGPRPEELAHMENHLRENFRLQKEQSDRRRAEVLAQRDLVESERQKLLQDIDQEEKVALQEQQRKAELEGKLKAMEKKMVQGKTVMEKAMNQEAQLKRKQRELRKQIHKEEKLKQQEEQQRHENEELEERCASQEEQVQKLTSRLHKLWDRYQRAQQEMVDVQQFNQGEREDMLSMIRDLRQTLKLKTLIMESFVPAHEVQNTHDRAVWDAENDEWRLRSARSNKENLPLRPLSALGLDRPTSEFARRSLAEDETDTRFRSDRMLVLEPELPERATEDYDHDPYLGERVERSLVLALTPGDDDGGAGPLRDGSQSRGDFEERQRRAKDSERPTTGHRVKRPPSGHPEGGRDRPSDRDFLGLGDRDRDRGLPPRAPAAPEFPQARGLVSRE
eukprot:TRINITY_DN32700_c0_g1_i1.p1 TRINITY_DN32700_c0_g1~~TRINITY_DN32700_c0_g1_i1.p1  ORF type:complete len:854 (-),score=225.24 TRINITY_DN32700_c0_g1_i1:44-2605(-)